MDKKILASVIKQHTTSDCPVEELLLHRPPALLIDKLLYADDTAAITSTLINADSPYYSTEHNGVPAWVGVEYMAQSISIWSGYQQRLADLPIKVGFLLGCKKYACQRAYFYKHLLLTIKVEPCYIDSSGLSSFDCIIYAKENDSEAPDSPGDAIANARINAVEPDDPLELVNWSRFSGR